MTNTRTSTEQKVLHQLFCLPENWRKMWHQPEHIDSSNPLCPHLCALYNPLQRPVTFRTMALFRFEILHCHKKNTKILTRLTAESKNSATYCSPLLNEMNGSWKMCTERSCDCEIYIYMKVSNRQITGVSKRDFFKFKSGEQFLPIFKKPTHVNWAIQIHPKCGSSAIVAPSLCKSKHT